MIIVMCQPSERLLKLDWVSSNHLYFTLSWVFWFGFFFGGGVYPTYQSYQWNSQNTPWLLWICPKVRDLAHAYTPTRIYFTSTISIWLRPIKSFNMAFHVNPHTWVVIVVFAKYSSLGSTLSRLAFKDVTGFPFSETSKIDDIDAFAGRFSTPTTIPYSLPVKNFPKLISGNRHSEYMNRKTLYRHLLVYSWES